MQRGQTQAPLVAGYAATAACPAPRQACICGQVRGWSRPQRATLWLSLVLLPTAACGGGQAQSSTSNVSAHARAHQIVACIRGGDVTDLPPAVAATGVTEDTVVIVQGDASAFSALRPPWRLVVRFGSPASYAKVHNPRVLIAAKASTFEALLKLSPTGAAQEDGPLATLLANAGFQLASRSGDIVTGRASLAQLEALLALDAVESLRASARAQQP